jgi:HSP20 family molecular chaperone IbpA
MTQKRSFFERLTGSIRMEEDEPVVMSQPVRKTNLYRSYNTNFQEDSYPIHDTTEIEETMSIEINQHEADDVVDEAELAVDVYETNDTVYVKTMTAGVKKEDLQISVTRETLTIKGHRENDSRGYTHHYQIQELFWGPFGRTIDLPAEVDIEQATASEHHGLVTIKLPKFDKKRQATLKVQ